MGVDEGLERVEGVDEALQLGLDRVQILFDVDLDVGADLGLEQRQGHAGEQVGDGIGVTLDQQPRVADIEVGQHAAAAGFGHGEGVARGLDLEADLGALGDHRGADPHGRQRPVAVDLIGQSLDGVAGQIAEVQGRRAVVEMDGAGGAERVRGRGLARRFVYLVGLVDEAVGVELGLLGGLQLVLDRRRGCQDADGLKRRSRGVGNGDRRTGRVLGQHQVVLGGADGDDAGRYFRRRRAGVGIVDAVAEAKQRVSRGNRYDLTLDGEGVAFGKPERGGRAGDGVGRDLVGGGGL